MNVIVYSLMCYGLTAVISFLVIAVIVALNKMLNRSKGAGEEGGEV